MQRLRASLQRRLRRSDYRPVALLRDDDQETDAFCIVYRSLSQRLLEAMRHQAIMGAEDSGNIEELRDFLESEDILTQARGHFGAVEQPARIEGHVRTMNCDIATATGSHACASYAVFTIATHTGEHYSIECYPCLCCRQVQMMASRKTKHNE